MATPGPGVTIKRPPPTPKNMSNPSTVDPTTDRPENIVWPAISVEQYAAFQRSQGEKVVRVGNVTWRQVRPFFFRPLLPYREQTVRPVRAPLRARLGGFQYAVPAGTAANSSLHLMLYENPAGYSLDGMDRRRRWEVRQATKHHVVRRLEDADEFKRKAFPAYRSFYDRTHYEFRADRRHEAGFARWADSVFQFPEIVVLGAYRGSDLGGVGISVLVEVTLVYMTAFCDQESLKLNVIALMLHTLRAGAAGCPQVKRIYLGVYGHQGQRHIHDFYLLRGCQAVAKPAILHLNPACALALRGFLPRQYARLCGQLEQPVGSHV